MRGGDGRVGVPCGVDSGVVRDSGRDMGMSARIRVGVEYSDVRVAREAGRRVPRRAAAGGGAAAPAASAAPRPPPGGPPKLRPRTAPRAAASPPRASARGTAQSPPASWRTPPTARDWRYCISLGAAISAARSAAFWRASGRWRPGCGGPLTRPSLACMANLVLTRRVHAHGVEAALEADGRIAHRLRRPRVAPRRRWRRPRPELGGRRRGREALSVCGRSRACPPQRSQPLNAHTPCAPAPPPPSPWTAVARGRSWLSGPPPPPLKTTPSRGGARPRGRPRRRPRGRARGRPRGCLGCGSRGLGGSGCRARPLRRPRGCGDGGDGGGSARLGGGRRERRRLRRLGIRGHHGGDARREASGSAFGNEFGVRFERRRRSLGGSGSLGGGRRRPSGARADRLRRRRPSPSGWQRCSRRSLCRARARASGSEAFARRAAARTLAEGRRVSVPAAAAT